MGGKRLRADHRADTRGLPWAGIPHAVIRSPAYRHLSLWGRAVLVEIVHEMNGYNNGSIGISQRQLGERLSTSNFRKIGRAVAELMEHGLIDVAAEGQWKARMARQYRLTFVNTGRPGSYRRATNDYLNWRPEKSGAETASARQRESAERGSAVSVPAAETGSTESRSYTVTSRFSSDEGASSLINEPYPATSAPAATDLARAA